MAFLHHVGVTPTFFTDKITEFNIPLHMENTRLSVLFLFDLYEWSNYRFGLM